jgi:hypothetical protein
MPSRMLTWTTLAIGCLASAQALAQDYQAKTIAQEVLNQGAALFDGREAEKIAATYVEGARIEMLSRDSETGKFKVEARSGRAEIEAMYKELFKGMNEPTTCKNTADDAHMVGTDILLIRGTFQPNASNPLTLKFVQVRLREGNAWRIHSLQLFLQP